MKNLIQINFQNIKNVGIRVDFNVPINDGSITETLTPGTGPDGDYHGAMQNEHASITQRSVYLG